MLLNKQTNQELDKIGDTYQYDFGARKLNSRVATTFVIKGENLRNLTATADCSCTTSTPNVIDKDTIEIDIIYKSSHMAHNINREVFVNYAENGENKSEKIKITGQIIK
jgi:hypothetical protein